MSEQEVVLLAEPENTNLVCEALQPRGHLPGGTGFQQQFEQFLADWESGNTLRAEQQSAADGSSSEQVAAAKKKQSRKTKQEPSAQADSVRQMGGQYLPEAELTAELATLENLSLAAQQGDTQALDQLRAALDNCPHLWRRLADLQVQIEETMAQQVAGQDVLRLEAFRKRASELRAVLLEGSTAPYLQLAISRLVACWLFAQFLELKYLTADRPSGMLRYLVQAEHRFESAMRTFSLAKRLEQQLAKQTQG